MSSLITLTTDLGEREPFAAMIKGVILSRSPQASIVDLSHQVPPRQVTEGAIFLLGALPYFPGGTIHLVNVAAGPRPIAAMIEGQIVLCPDNGVITLLEMLHRVSEVRAIRLPEECQGRQVLFGREVFAPMAARLTQGEAFEDLGPVIEDWHRLDIPRPKLDDPTKIEGRIMHIDRFGNLITNIHRRHFEGKQVDRVACGSFSAYEMSEAYDEVPEGKPLALIGQSGYLELAYHGDNASQRLGLAPGILVTVFLER